MLRRLYHEQPDTFAFTAANDTWANEQVKKYPEGRQASAIIPLLWRAQEQESWLTRPAIEHIADRLGMAYIRALEVASFYFMFQLQPVGKIAHVQVCGTTTCMTCGAEDLIGACREKIAPNAQEVSADGNFSWEEVECLGACTNAPMVQIGKDFYEDLTTQKFVDILDAFARGEVPTPGPQNGRYAAEPLSGLTSLRDFESGRTQYNASVDRAIYIGDTVKRITGDEPPMLKRPIGKAAPKKAAPKKAAPTKATKTAAPKAAKKPKSRKAARKGGADDLKMIKGIGPKLEAMLNGLGLFHFDQIAAWTDGEINWADTELVGFKGRVTRDNWVEQAKTLADGGETEFSNRVEKGGVYS